MSTFKNFRQGQGSAGVNGQQQQQPLRSRLRSIGSSTYHRSPSIKRSADDPITMQGWLYKQGSDGFMLWKKRWFVLSKYCLYYYKNSDEEKLLGSILLPSYTISPCTEIEGKLFRKRYSFRAEHANMRTYYFAAETRELMVQWMNALSLATILQDTNGQQESQRYQHLQTAEQARPGTSTYDRGTRGGGADFSNYPPNGWSFSHLEDHIQPLYANAPPKPRRLTESSEQSPECMRGTHPYAKSQQEYMIRNDRTYPQGIPEVPARRQYPVMNQYKASEHFTKSINPASAQVRMMDSYKRPSQVEYEELYNITSRGVCAPHQSTLAMQAQPQQQRQMGRPHSADFLERDVRKYSQPIIQQRFEQSSAMPNNGPILEPRRPKSSMDVLSSDSFHWSEESYAQKMRQTAPYFAGKAGDMSVTKGTAGSSTPNEPSTRISSNQLPRADQSKIGEYSSLRTHTAQDNIGEFTRSVSARIPRDIKNNEGNLTEDLDESLIHRHRRHRGSLHSSSSKDIDSASEQQREESMKRLLEWKQRMLQSPLTRKPSSSSAKGSSQTLSTGFGDSATTTTEPPYPSVDTTDLPQPKTREQSASEGKSPKRECCRKELSEDVAPKLHRCCHRRHSRRLRTEQKSEQSPVDEKSRQQRRHSHHCHHHSPRHQQHHHHHHQRPHNHHCRSRVQERRPAERSPEESHTRRRSSCRSDTCVEHRRRRSRSRESRSAKSSEKLHDGFPSLSSVAKTTELSSEEDAGSYGTRSVRRSIQLDDLSSCSSGNESCTDYEDCCAECESRYNYGSRPCSRSSVGSLTGSACEELYGSVRTFIVKEDNSSKDFPGSKYNETIVATGSLENEETLTLSSKCSDSGYDTVRMSEKVIANDSKLRYPEAPPEIGKRNSNESLKSRTSLQSSYKRLTKYESPPENIVQNRIKAFENTGSLKCQMREPLKVSPTCSTQAQVSNLRPITIGAEKESIENFVQLNRATPCKEMETKFATKKACSFTAQKGIENSASTASYSSEVWTDMPIYDSFDDFEPKSRSEIGIPGVGSDGQFGVTKYADAEQRTDLGTREGHYLPMAPSKKAGISGDLFSHSRSNSASSASQALILDTLLREDTENSYIEMTVGENGMSETYDSKEKVSEQKLELESPYEFLYKATTSMEAVYTEVGDDQKDTSTCSTVLPDILSNSGNLKRQKSDSSDADDEASKELDPANIPRHPRFSLSDTFRPASYYLGGLNPRSVVTSEQPDSSDSDLVSPPPIPASSPPLDASLEVDNYEKDKISLLKEDSESLDISMFCVASPDCDNSVDTLKGAVLDEYFGTGQIENPIPKERSVKFTADTPTSLKGSGYTEDFREKGQNSNFNPCPSRDCCENLGLPSVSGVTDVQESEHCEYSTEMQNFIRSHAENFIRTNSSSSRLTQSPVPRTPNLYPAEQTPTGTRHPNAPYYYADILKLEGSLSKSFDGIRNENLLSGQNEVPKLNNQLSSENKNLEKQTNIGKMVNRIGQTNSERPESSGKHFTEEIKNTVDLIGLMKGNLDEKNIYSTGMFHKHKISKFGYRSQTPEPLSDAVNLYSCSFEPKNCGCSQNSSLTTRRSRSVEGLLDEVDTSLSTYSRSEPSRTEPETEQRNPQVSTDLGSEVKRPRRNNSLRHTRSLDDLEQKSRPEAASSGRQSADILTGNAPISRKIVRDVTYVNDSVTAHMRKSNSKEYTEDYREVRKIKRHVVSTPVNDPADDGIHYERLDPRVRLTQTGRYCYNSDEIPRDTRRLESLKQHGKANKHPKTGSQSFLEEGIYPTKLPSFQIDREKLRQWDLMSSAPVGMVDVTQKSHQLDSSQMENTRRNSQNMIVNTPLSSPASGSGSVIGRDPLPPRQTPTSPQVQQQVITQTDKSPEFQPMGNGYGNVEPAMRTNGADFFNRKADNGWNLNVSAGELLGRTHEELVLLLIQLRRQSANVCKAMEKCHREIETKARLVELDTESKTEHAKTLEDLKKRLTELERSYEKGKPLVNLVDNMVKLGSLYRSGVSQFSPTDMRDKLDFNHKIQEQRMLAEEQKDWQRFSPDMGQLQAKVEELYKLDRLLQQESNTLQCLKHDKEMLESALGGLKYKLQGIQGNPVELERYKKQQHLLQQELSHVRSVLARNSKKLEETAVANTRLESELIVLRQKLQWSTRSNEENMNCAANIYLLESELKRVQMLVGDLQRQRYELSNQVKQLTEKSQSLSQQMHSSPTDVPNMASLNAKRRSTNGWIETDLDNDSNQELSTGRSPITVTSSDRSPITMTSMFPSHNLNMLYSTDDKKQGTSPSYDASDYSDDNYIPPPAPLDPQYCEMMDISEADDRMKKYYGIIPREKPQEIKTVRIVKRESERRQRDRDRTGNIGIPVTSGTKKMSVLEELQQESSFTTNKIEDGRFQVDSRIPTDISSIHRSSSLSYISADQSDSIYRSSRDIYAPLPRAESSHVLNNFLTRNLRQAETVPKTLSASERLFGCDLSNIKVPTTDMKMCKSPDTRCDLQCTSVYRSEAAKQIVQELSQSKSSSKESLSKRLIPREKRRHHTVSSAKSILPMDPVHGSTRARDDVDMERALRPRLNGTPDVVRSTLSRTDNVKYSADTIDSILGTPSKIRIPERYVPESAPQLSPEEQNRRSKKAEAIRKMLSETALSPTETPEVQEETEASLLNKKKLAEEKKQREHLLQLNQIIAQQVMEKSKVVAGTNSQTLQQR